MPRNAVTARMPRIPTGIQTDSSRTIVDSRKAPNTVNGTARTAKVMAKVERQNGHDVAGVKHRWWPFGGGDR